MFTGHGSRRQSLSGSLQAGIRFFPHPTPAAPRPHLAVRFPHPVGRDGVIQFRIPIDNERLRQFLSPGGRIGVSSGLGNLSNGPHPILGQAFPAVASVSTFRLFSLTRFNRTSRMFAISFRPSLLAALVLAAMTAAFRQVVSALGVSTSEKESIVTTASHVRLPSRMCR